MILDMMCHWRYVLDNLFGEVQSVSAASARPTFRSAGTKPASRIGQLPTMPPTQRCN